MLSSGWVPQASVIKKMSSNCHQALGKASRKKVGVLLDFVPMSGGGRALPKFFGTLALKNSGTSCPNLGVGGLMLFGQNPKEQPLFSGDLPSVSWVSEKCGQRSDLGQIKDLRIRAISMAWCRDDFFYSMVCRASWKCNRAEIFLKQTSLTLFNQLSKVGLGSGDNL